MINTTSIQWDKVNGLLPVVVQHHQTQQVLMLGYMTPEALNQTLETQQITFWSRTKSRLWTKGESSGHFLMLKTAALDCDQDTLLIQAEPKGPTCHLGTVSCFNPAPPANNLLFLTQLEALLGERKQADPTTSYTASLFAKGTKRIAQKVGEEGVEVALAATVHDREELINESADLLYHLLVLLQDQDVALNDVIKQLQSRHA
jgi:phosphoribosyl-ATP pyrophosphohydrolase/phosphoribosyl-AMP cyclohydrolase